MRPGPKPRVIRPVKLLISLPEDLLGEVKLTLVPFGAFYPPKGSMSALVESLLRDYLRDLANLYRDNP